jgi:hypothetical protein
VGETMKGKLKSSEDWLKKVLAEFERDTPFTPLERFKGVSRNLVRFCEGLGYNNQQKGR